MRSKPRSPPPDSVSRWRPAQLDAAVDLLGVGLVAAFTVWTTLVGLLTDRDPVPALALVAAGLVTFGFVRAVSRRFPPVGPTAVLLAGAVLPFLAVGGTVASGRRFGPLEYANASALFYVLVAAAGGMLAVSREGRFLRLTGVLALLAAAGAVVASGSDAATALLLLLPVAALARRPPAVRLFLSCAAAFVAAAVVVTIVLGTLHGAALAPATIEGRASTAFSARRLDLWRDALQIVARDPATGVGPGGFVSHSPTALQDEDAVAVHNEYLQAAAELGLPGLLLAVTLPLWGFARLRWTRLDSGVSFAGAALAAVGIHASVDYVLHAPAIVTAVTALVGAGSAPARRLAVRAAVPVTKAAGKGRRPGRERGHVRTPPPGSLDSPHLRR